ncbi:MAG: hypothetical protein LBI12_05885 [Treponema sp.]|jgi:hypothetical protein|nr:hypothetical protein [Treponema sp.]
MKRISLALILIAVLSFSAFGQNTDSIDLLLLLNTSTGMGSSYENVNDYITGSFLSEFLRVGDTFHLIPFSAVPRLDIARRISDIGDVETIIGRMFLQYPVEIGNNTGNAISFAEQYIRTLPSRPKKIVLVSIGSSDINSLVSSAKDRLRSANATLDYVQVTPGQPITNFPRADRDSSARAQQPSVDTQTSEADTRAETVTPNDSFQSTQEQQGTVYPVTEQLTESSPWASYLPFIIGLIILLLLIIGLIMFFSSRKLSASPNRVMSEVSSSKAGEQPKFTDHSEDLKKYASSQSKQRTTPYSDRHEKTKGGKPVYINPTGPLILDLYVEDQNRAIGKRNIHNLKSDYSLSVGGGNSDFQIFLVPIPPRIGELRRNGSQLTFIPKNHKYFPDLGSSELRDCLNKTIRIISDKNYEMRFRFEMYEDPLEALNRVLNSIKVPG